MGSELLDLLGLLVDDVGRISDVVVDELLVRLVDERCEEEDRGGDKSKTPNRDNLDQVVGEECAEESLAPVSMPSAIIGVGSLQQQTQRHFLQKRCAETR